MTPSQAAKGVARGSAPVAGQYAPALPLFGQIRIVCLVKRGADPQQSQKLIPGPCHPSAGRRSRRVLVAAARTILGSPRTMVTIISCRARLARSVSGGAPLRSLEVDHNPTMLWPDSRFLAFYWRCQRRGDARDKLQSRTVRLWPSFDRAELSGAAGI
jgi:hypothetical protein